MKIASASLQMEANYQATRQREVAVTLRYSRPAEAPPPVAAVTVDLSAGAAAAAQGEAACRSDEAPPDDGLEPRLSLIRSIMEMLFGRRIEVFNARELSAVQRKEASSSEPPAAAAEAVAAAGGPVIYRRHESYSETESSQFAASGTIRTADGREIAFDLQIDMARSFATESDSIIQIGAPARKKDPLVLNFSGPAGQLSDMRFNFDLDADGQVEQINRLAAGSAFLALDRNGDGQVNDGTELFGARSGDGFADLAAYDGDGNGWIDEGDAVYGDLRLWRGGSDGQGSLQTLAEAGVGALALSRLATPFSINDAANRQMGEVRASGLFLREDGQAGSLQQIDLSV